MAKRAVYWDSCAWIGLINDEPDKATACRYIMEEAEKGNIVIWTSALTIAEVYKAKCATTTGIATEKDKDFENYILEPHVEIVQLTRDVASVARRLLRTPSLNPPLKKPNDAIHLASAVLNDVTEFHTFDKDDLLGLDGKVVAQNGTPIAIRTCPEPPPAAPAVPTLPLFGGENANEAEAGEV